MSLIAYNDIFPLGAIIDDHVKSKTKHLEDRIKELEHDSKVIVYLMENFPSLLEQLKTMVTKNEN
jgi:hypothetical protein